MHQSARGRALFAATAFLPFVMTATAAQDPVPVPAALAEATPADEKIDPALRADLLQLEAKGFIETAGKARTTMRVVIELVRQAGDPTFETSVARDPVKEVAAGVFARQAQFLRVLEATVEPLTWRETQVIDGLTLQYSLVAEVASARALRTLALRPDVKYLWKDHLNQLFTSEGRAITGSAAAAASGWTGSGVGVAVIDTRFDLLHPELGSSTTLPNAVVKGGQNFSDPGQSIHSQVFNDCYHGTGTASIVRRYAAGVSLYCLTVFPNAYDSVIANAINWCVTNRNGTGGGAPIRALSMSLGGGRYFSAVTSGTMHSACGTAVSNGILCLAASGNDGWGDSMGSPAASTNCVSIGSVWDATNAPYAPFPPAYCSDTSRLQDERCCYSDTASFLSLYAPSEQVICARCGGGTFALGGTSSATPAAAGLVAQFLHARPTYAGNQSGVVSLFQTTGVSVTGDTARRRVNLVAAINAAGGGGGGGGQLQNGVTQNYSVPTSATSSYTISIPANAQNLVVTITGTGDADLYVKRLPINWPADQGAHNEAEFKAPYIGGSAESVTFAAPAAATWNVLLHGYSGNPSGTIRATWTVGSGGSWHNVSWVQQTPHNYANNQVYRYTYTLPGATQVGVHFNRIATEAGYDFVRIKNGSGATLYTVSGSPITNGVGTAFGRTDGWAYIAGNTITVELTTDYSITAYGLLTDLASAFY